MKYDEFINLRNRGKVRAGIDESVALTLMDHLPESEQKLGASWHWTFILFSLASVAVAVFWKWWVGLLMLIFVCPAMFRATKQSSAKQVLDYAEKNEQFFNLLVENNVVVFKQDP